MVARKAYDENSIEVLEFPDDVRKRPGMYIGGTTSEGMHHIYKEILDNAVDEAVAGHCKKITVTNENDGILSIEDDGRGIPTGINKAKGVSALELVFTVLHAGGKFSNDEEGGGYKTCFTGDTEIRLLDGTVRTFKWLTENYKKKEFWVISCLPDGTIVPAKAINPHKTKEVTELAVVTLDNGKKERCTKDHRWMRRDGTYTEAKDLKPGDSLMPFYYTKDEQRHLLFKPNNYKTQPKHRGLPYIPLYREVYKYVNNEDYAFEEQTHHIDFDPTNDCPENLEKITKKDHYTLHGIKQCELNGPDSLVRYNQSEKGRNKSRKTMQYVIESGQHFSQTEENSKLRSEQFKQANKKDLKVLQQQGKFQRAYLYITESLGLEFNEETYEKYKQWGDAGFSQFEDLFPKGIEELKSSIPDYLKRKKRAGVSKQDILDTYKPVDKERLTANVNNHKVVSVEIITLDTPEPVYDIQVPGPNNFALESGVFVHNSGGLHGVGASVTNAVSEFLEVYVKREDKIWTQAYERGIKQFDVKKTNECPISFRGKTGTYVRFRPDNKVFKHIELKWEYERIIRRCREVAFLVPGLEIEIKGWDDEEEPDVTFKYDNGLHDYVDYQMTGKEPVVPTIDMNVNLEEVGCSAQVVFTYETEFEEHLATFANNIPTYEGGVHTNAFLNALLKCVIEIGEKEKITKDFGGKVKKSDILEGLHGVILVRLQQPEFEGQTKTKLGNPEIRTPLEEAFIEQLQKMFEKKLKAEGTIIAKKILQSVIARENARKAKELTRKKGGLEHFTLKGKLADRESKDPAECELFLVEGDSAGGSAKQGRNNRFQAILPLRGKVINVEKTTVNKAMENRELRALISALNVTPQANGVVPDADDLRFHNIVLLADADPDGAHITCLLITFFYKFMRTLIERGHIKVAQPPLYRVRRGKKTIYLHDDEELEEYKSKYKKDDNIEVGRFKGLGEMNPEQLAETVLNPATRSLVQISVDDAEQAAKTIDALFGKEVEGRKKFLFKDLNLTAASTVQ